MAIDQEVYVGLQYHGLAGVSEACLNGVMRLIQYGDRITGARILSCGNTHCLLLTINNGDLVFIGSGFRSGYGGQGPRTFSQVLRLLEDHGAEIDEITVQQEILDRIDSTSLTRVDVEAMETARPRRPSRWYDYVYDDHWVDKGRRRIWSGFPPTIPFSIIDHRIIDLAVDFWEAPDERLLTGYRRLEDTIRARIESTEHGRKLFSLAFMGTDSKLLWKGVDGAEQAGRANLFTGAYMAHRNPRAHRELPGSSDQELAEFLLLNHLYMLEREARLRPDVNESCRR